MGNLLVQHFLSSLCRLFQYFIHQWSIMNIEFDFSDVNSAWLAQPKLLDFYVPRIENDMQILHSQYNTCHQKDRMTKASIQKQFSAQFLGGFHWNCRNNNIMWSIIDDILYTVFPDDAWWHWYFWYFSFFWYIAKKAKKQKKSQQSCTISNESSFLCVLVSFFGGGCLHSFLSFVFLVVFFWAVFLVFLFALWSTFFL